MFELINKIIWILKKQIDLSSVVGFDMHISLWTIFLFCAVLGIGFSIFRRIYS